MSRLHSSKKDKSNERFWLVGIPFGLLLLFLMMTGPQILNALHPRTEIEGINLPQDVQLEITLKLSVDDLDKNYFSLPCVMEMGIMENSTRKLDYNIFIKPEPAMAFSSATGVSIPFANLHSEGEYISFSEDYEQSWRFQKYSYEINLSSAYVLKANARFPGDFYASSIVYVWFNTPFYPNIKLSPASSLPRGFIAVLSAPEFIKPDDFYRNRIQPFERLFIGKPSCDVLAFQIVVQRDGSSLWLYSISTVIVLYASYEVLVLSRFRISELKDRLSIFIGLAIASIAFLWSTRQVANVASWSEVVLIVMLGVSISLEVKDAYQSERTQSIYPAMFE